MADSSACRASLHSSDMVRSAMLLVLKLCACFAAMKWNSCHRYLMFERRHTAYTAGTAAGTAMDGGAATAGNGCKKSIAAHAPQQLWRGAAVTAAGAARAPQHSDELGRSDGCSSDGGGCSESAVAQRWMAGAVMDGGRSSDGGGCSESTMAQRLTGTAIAPQHRDGLGRSDGRSMRSSDGGRRSESVVAQCVDKAQV